MGTTPWDNAPTAILGSGAARSALLRLWLGCLLLGLGMQRYAVAADGWAHVTDGTVVLFRHALAPGGGDPAGFTLDDCSTQRNLNSEGRAQARRIGTEFAARAVHVAAVWSSQWCRARETADLAFPGRRVDHPAFNSFFSVPGSAHAQTLAAQKLLQGWSGPGVLVIFTHQVNITALTNIVPASGEGIVVKPTAGSLQLLGRVTP